jgi:thioredoxin 1
LTQPTTPLSALREPGDVFLAVSLSGFRLEEFTMADQRAGHTSKAKTVTDADFDVEVLKSDKPVIVDFWAPWCAPCRQVSPILDEIAAAHADKIEVVKLNTDENPSVTARYGVTALPTIAVYSGGELVKTVVGARPKPILLREFSDWLG